MDTHNKRINRMNMNTFGRMSLVPDGTVEQPDLKNCLWIPFFFNYPEPEEEVTNVAIFNGLTTLITTAII